MSATNVNTSANFITKTNATGIYVLPALPAGQYRVAVTKSGFKQSILAGLELHTQDTISHNFHLELGTASESVTVNGSGIEINTEDATVGTIVDRQLVANIPLNGRSLQSLLTLVPGVATVPGSGQVGYQGEITVDGQRTESNYFTVDGVSANSGAKIDNETGGAGYSGSIPGMTIIGTTQSMVSIDDLEEFRAATSTYSADQGRTPGGQFAMTTRSGTKDWHGALSEYFRNDDLDANNWFNGYCNPITDSNDCQTFAPFPKGAEKQNDFGGTLGGPVVIPHLYNGKDKTFFFVSYEGLRLIQPVPPSTRVVPDKQMRLDAPAVLQPFLNAYAIQNGAEMTQSPGLAYYNLVYSEPSHLDSTSVRIDHNFGDKLKIFGRYANTPSGGWYFNDLPIHDNTRANVHSITLGSTDMVTPTQTNELRFNYTFNDSGEFELASNFGGAVPIGVGVVDGPDGQPLTPIGSQLTFRTYFDTGGKAEFELEGNDYRGCGKTLRLSPVTAIWIELVDSIVMRGDDQQQTAMFSYLTLAQRIPADHPARQIRVLVDRALQQMDAEFEKLYSTTGRPSIAPERLLRATLLMILFSIRSERQLMEQMNYNLLFRWFVGLEMDDAVWDVTVFTKNRERLISGAVSQRLLEEVLVQAREHALLSEEHFTVDGTLIQAWASARSFQEKKDPPQPGKGSGSKGALLLRDKVESKTDPEARLYKKAAPDKSVPAYLGHTLMENRNGLAVAAEATEAGNAAEREAAIRMLDRVVTKNQRKPEQGITLGADTLYQEEKFIQDLRQREVAPHISQYTQGGSNMGKNSLNETERADQRQTISQKKRKLIEKIFGWAKLDSVLRQVKVRGLKRVDWFYRMAMAAYNLMRMRRLIPIQSEDC